MTCPHCQTIVTNRNTVVCPYCGATLVYEIVTPTDPTAPLLQVQRPAPKPPLNTMRPLLTGNGLFDATLGFIGELAAFVLVAFAVWRFVTLLDSEVQPVIADLFGLLGMWTTALFLVWHTRQMRKRYPAFAHGWQTGRDTWGKGADIATTFICGLVVLTVLFPVGWLVMCVGMAFPPVGWIVAWATVYGVGMLARRMLTGRKGKNVP